MTKYKEGRHQFHNSGHREIGGKRIYLRSLWEANYARWLQYQKEKGWIEDWIYEPYTFYFEGIKRGCVCYKPDFKVINKDGTHYWIEVKGYYDPKSLTKIKRFNKYYPEEKLKLIDKKWFVRDGHKVQAFIKDWETLCGSKRIISSKLITLRRSLLRKS